MNVVVPYANDISDPEVHYCVRLNFALLGLEPQWVRMNEPNDYALLLNRLWNEGEKFVIVEHDVIVWRGAIEEVWSCPEPFCGYDGMLTCVKIEPSGVCPVNPRTTWVMLDGQLHSGLFKRGISFHDHVERAPVINLNRHNLPAGASV